MAVELRPILAIPLHRRLLRDALLDEVIDPSWFDERGRYVKLFGRAHAYATKVREPGSASSSNSLTDDIFAKFDIVLGSKTVAP